MSWIVDLMKEVPQAAVLKERLALQDEKFTQAQKEKDDTIASLLSQNETLQADNERLRT